MSVVFAACLVTALIGWDLMGWPVIGF